MAASPDLTVFCAELAQSQAEVDGKLRAQDAELQQLQQGLTDLEVQGRRTETTTTQRLEQRTEVVLDTMTERFNNAFDEVKPVVEALDYTVRGRANQIWWQHKTQQGSVDEMVAAIEAKLQKQAGNNTGGKKVRIRIPERANL